MTEERAKCCGNCWWWIEYWLCEGGWCQRNGSDMLASEGCSRWKQDRCEDGDQDDYDEEEDDHGP
jgi:hypothetical protein